MKRMLMLAAAMSLLAGPAAMAQHRHDGDGRHASAARHAHARQANRAQHRRAVTRRAQHHRAVTTRRAQARRAHARRTYNRRAYNRGYSHARHYNRGYTHRMGNRRWRHVNRVGRWHRGYRLPRAYWGRSHWVNWRTHYLWAPPYGYQWVYIDGDYVLMAIATGLIADIVAGY
jgi:Ni/Co efflux regulator RcnB